MGIGRLRRNFFNGYHDGRENVQNHAQPAHFGDCFSITACDSLGFLQSTPSPAEREAEEYAVYNEFLNTKQAENKYKSTVRLLVFRI